MSEEYEELKIFFDIEMNKNTNLTNEINTIKEKLSEDNPFIRNYKKDIKTNEGRKKIRISYFKLMKK
jgi:hypothetical protein